MTEDAFKCYPLRSDSLARFSQLYDERLAGGRGWLALTPAEAATRLSRVLDMEPTRESRVPLGVRARLAGWVLQPAPSRRGFHRFASEYFDWDDPPFFKHFLRIDADAERPARPLLRRQRLRPREHGTAGRGRVHRELLSQRVKRGARVRPRAPSRRRARAASATAPGRGG